MFSPSLSLGTMVTQESMNEELRSYHLKELAINWEDGLVDLMALKEYMNLMYPDVDYRTSEEYKVIRKFAGVDIRKLSPSTVEELKALIMTWLKVSF